MVQVRAVTAAVTVANKPVRPVWTADADGRSVVQQIRAYDSKGPGVLGYYLDFRADLASLLNVRAKEWNGDTWEWTKDPAVLNLVKELRSDTGEDMPLIIRHMSREVAAIDEVVIAVMPGNGTSKATLVILPADKAVEVTATAGKKPLLAWPLVGESTRTSISEHEAVAGNWIILRSYDLTGLEESPYPRAVKVYTPSYEARGKTRLTLERALPDLERVQRAQAAIHRSTTSALINNGTAWFQGNPSDLDTDRNGVPTKPLGKMIFELIQHAKELVKPGNSGRPQDAFPAPIVSQTPPQFVQIGKVIDKDLIVVKDDALKDLSRSLNVPMSVIVEGPGSGTRLLNEWLQDKSIRETSALPLVKLVTSGLDQVWFQNALIAAGITDKSYALFPDTDEFMAKTVEFDDLVTAVEVGALQPGVLAEYLSKTEYALEVPEGMTDWDRWVMTRDKASDKHSGKDGLTPYEVKASLGESPWWDKP